MQTGKEGFRLSPQQRRVWALQGEAPPLVAQSITLIRGRLDLKDLRGALYGVVSRNEILRTTFHYVPGLSLAIQVIEEGADYILADAELNARDISDDISEVRRLADEQASLPFDLERGPMLRALLIRASDEKSFLVLTLPSLCADSGGIKKLAHELFAVFAGGSGPEPPSSDRVQYLQFSEWQNELLDDESSGAGKTYWRKRGSANIPAPSLPLERRLPKSLSGSPGVIDVVIDDEQAGRIEVITSEHGLNHESFLLACFNALLWRLSQQQDIAVTMLFEGRRFEEVNDAIGLYSKALPLKTRMGDRAFIELAEECGRQVRDASDWFDYFAWDDSEEKEEFSFDLSLYDVEAARPSLPVCFEYSELPAEGRVNGSTFEILDHYAHIDRFKLKLAFTRAGGSLAARLYYLSELFEETDARRLGEQFKALLSSAVLRPDLRIGALDILSDEEKRRLIIEFNETKSAYPENKCMHTLFEEQVERTPAAVAVNFKEDRLTYRELDDKANQLARHLKSLGVGPETIVAICMERSTEMVVGLLAILKAGGGYLPLEPGHPTERLAYMLDDAGAKVILTQDRFASRITVASATVLPVDSMSDTLAAYDSLPPVNETLPGNVAYLIYTSGSTGRPKGVVVPHRGVVNYLSWCAGAYPLGEGNGTAVQSPIGFDLTVTSLFAPLVRGRAVTLVPEEEGIEGLSAVMRERSDLSLVKITPSHLEVLSEMISADEAAGCARAFVIGGEALLSESLSYWRENSPDTRLINEYGPTEAVVGCCVYEVKKQEILAGSVPIGRPIANARIYLLDANLLPVPTGVPGELFIGGDCLARGYLNRADLTAERFVPDPFGAEPGARIYRTGDVARHRPDGDIDYLGRSDQQVKVRGIRVELGEVEAALSQHPAIRDAIVMVREDIPGDKRLAAYYVAQEGQTPGIDDLRAFLGDMLPEYMIPASFMMMSSFPLSPNGKVNRAELPAPEGLRPRLQAAYVPPQSEAEQKISAVWEEVLRIDKVGIYDNFFDLGGHSLLVVTVNRKLRETFKKDISMVDMFRYPTINSLAKYLTEEVAEEESFQESERRAKTRKDSLARQRQLRQQRRAARK